jgi:uncharacterized protein YodC (DUF2158 family)
MGWGMENEFKPGDVVTLKSGGWPMTVRGIARDGDVICWWHGVPHAREGKNPGSQLHTEGFHPAMLTRIADPIGERLGKAEALARLHGETS